MFWTRLASGVVLIIIALLTMGFGGIPLILTLLFISLVAFRELTLVLLDRTNDRRVNLLEMTGYLGVISYYASVFFTDTDTYSLMTMVCVVMAMMLVYVVSFPKYTANQVTASVFAFLYAPVMLSFIYKTREFSDGGYMVWLILISSWGCDTFAYVFGKLFGKRHVFPVLSPKKSLAGCIGGVCGSAVLGALYAYFFVEKVMKAGSLVLPFACICAAGAVMSMVGDLAASGIKRNHQIKDYGKLIPGHGGIMDRFDSMIVTAPMIYFLANVFLELQ